MPASFDVVIIGSGFGGAVTACRLAEAGASVCVFERGRRWEPGTYPRRLRDPWLFDSRRPQKKNGWLDIRAFRRLIVVQGAGVGGGSLCYSSVLLRGEESVFADGWPAQINYHELAADYDRVSEMLRPRTVPVGQHTRRHQLLRESAQRSGYEQRVFDAPLAVSFDEQFRYDQPGAIDKQNTRAFRNPQGRWQGTCVHLGNCDIGCDVQAKNSLDLNYLAQAEQRGAEIRELHVVRAIIPEERGYRVTFDRIQDGRLMPASVNCVRVVLAAGSLGSTELLLRCRDEFGTLPNISPMLGQRSRRKWQRACSGVLQGPRTG